MTRSLFHSSVAGAFTKGPGHPGLFCSSPSLCPRTAVIVWATTQGRKRGISHRQSWIPRCFGGSIREWYGPTEETEHENRDFLTINKLQLGLDFCHQFHIGGTPS